MGSIELIKELIKIKEERLMIGPFEMIEKHGDHEEVIFCNDKNVGLKAIIAIHNTALGPALGGTRMWNYRSEEEALIDVLRLSRGMTYKAAAAGLNLGRWEGCYYWGS
jgi:leucine dehydrogenase